MALIFLLLPPLGGCRRNAAPPADTLVVAVESAPTQLDPRYAVDAYSSRIGELVFASLTRPAADGGFVPYLASAWRQPDPLSYVFELRRDFRFHDGSPVTADDIAATYRSILDPSAASPKRAALASLSAVEVEAADRIRFRLSAPDAAFLSATEIGILPAKLAIAGPLPPRALLGSGPYRIEEIDGPDTIELGAFDGFAEGRATIEHIRFRVLPDAVMRALELRHGSVDLVQNAIEPDTVDWLDRNEPGLRVLRGPYDAYQYLGMNLTHAPLGDVRVRRAIAYAIDREAIAAHVLKGQVRVASGLLPPHHWAFNGEVKIYGYDPAKARRLLDRAGWRDPDGPRPRFTLSYKTTTLELRRRIAEVLAEQLAAVGIELRIESYEWGTFFSDVRKGNFHLYSLAWVGIRDPDLMRSVFNSRMTPPDGNNRGRYSDPRTDRLTERGLRVSGDRRKRVYARLQKRNSRKLPYIPLWWPDNVTLLSDRVKDFTPDPSGGLYGLALARLATPATGSAAGR